MESFERSKAVINLGKRLVTALNLGDDMLAQWIAHVIAERINAAEHALPEERASAENACSQAIFSLWEHRNSLPSHMRPFRELDPLLQTLESLNVESGAGFRYFPRHPSNEELEGAVASGKRFLNAAVNLDYSARVLIQYLLSAASQEAAEKASPWFDAALDAEADAVLEQRVVEFVSVGGKASDTCEAARKALLDKIEKLELFSQLATAVAADLRSQLDPPAADDDGHDI